ncbi:MAG: hypothetical protein Q7O04_00990 [Candidatus Omnitrophota bacterium]|nr:hypothetical protein [Candidatus Omnitrophota bacterium]
MFVLGAFAWFWIVFGIIFLVNPEKFRKALQSKGYIVFRNYLFLIVLATSLLLINLAFRNSAVVAKVLAVFGIIGIIKAFFILKSKLAKKIFYWFGERPVKFLKGLAIFYIAIGIAILYFNR